GRTGWMDEKNVVGQFENQWPILARASWPVHGYAGWPRIWKNEIYLGVEEVPIQTEVSVCDKEALVWRNFVQASQGGCEIGVGRWRWGSRLRGAARGFLCLLNQGVSLGDGDSSLPRRTYGDFPEGLHVIVVARPWTVAREL